MFCNPKESECTVISSLVYGHQGQIELCKNQEGKNIKVNRERENKKKRNQFGNNDDDKFNKKSSA